MDYLPDSSRRAFLKVSLVAGGGLLVGFSLNGCSEPEGAAEAFLRDAARRGGLAPNAWLRLDPDGTVTVRVSGSEMGQGVFTALPMLVAEELDVDWGQIRAEFAPADKAYANPLMGRQQTGGSTAVRGMWQPLREASRAAREMLLKAAAGRWQVATEECETASGRVLHTQSGRSVSYPELLAEAAALPSPERVRLKEPKEFRVIGKPLPRLDTPAKIDGSAQFAQDFHRPGMLTASVIRCPVFGGRLRRFDPAPALAMPGVRSVLAIDSGVAVIADHFWAALKGREALRPQWEEGPHAALDSAGIRRDFEHALGHGLIARMEGDVASAWGGAQSLDALYEVPYLAHACMEPLSCAAEITAEGCDIWVGTQAQTRTQELGMEISGLPRERVRVHTLFLGGGFGRRGETDFVRDALLLARQTGRPIKVLWTREDDLRHDFYRPATLNRLRAAWRPDGRLVAWQHRIAGPSITARLWPKGVKDGMDKSSVEGAADLPYAIPNLEVTYAMVNPPVPVGYWRGVGNSQNTYVTESFFDEVAGAVGRDPFELRRELLAGQPRLRAVLELAAERAGWGTPLTDGRCRGIAVASSFGSHVAEVAELSLDGGAVRVHRVVCAVDCGSVVNPSIVEAQMESGIAYGLTAALKGEITVAAGRIVQSNFHDYPLPRFDEMPAVEVHIVPSDLPPGGVGEPGTPPIAPAVANAIFAATGRPVRRLPIRLT